MTPTTRLPTAATLARVPRAREQLIRHATAIFAAKGYAAASTREICDAAGVNVAAIHYYFGDKERLYRETLRRPIAEMMEAFGRFDDPGLAFDDAIRMFFAPFVRMASNSPDAAYDAQVMKLHLREVLEPSGAFREIVEQTIAPAHAALSGVIARHCGLDGADDDIHQIAFALGAMANDYCMSRELMKMLAPGVLDRPAANERILDGLVRYARALLDDEIARRKGAARPARARGQQSDTRPLGTRHVQARKQAPVRTRAR